MGVFASSSAVWMYVNSINPQHATVLVGLAIAGTHFSFNSIQLILIICMQDLRITG